MHGSKVKLNSHNNSDTEQDGRHSFFDVIQLVRSFGGIRALDKVTFSLDKGSVVSMIGPNGAGKSTFINVVTGLFPPLLGEVYFRGQNVTALPAHMIASIGIARTFQLVEPFSSLTVLENAMVGLHTKSQAGLFAVGLRLLSAQKEEKRIREEAMENLKLVGLEARASDLISSLPLGERKLVGIARALGMKPKLLMTDEPVAGLAAHEVGKIVELIHNLSDCGLTILIIEHNMDFVMSISERVIVLDRGRKIADGVPDDVRANDAVIKAYLGDEV
jgi:branched-chain amino acid transport system ATP-binding protein